jgi:hypothetical protein
MVITRTRALVLGVAAVVTVLLLQVFNSVVCYKLDMAAFMGTLMFVAVPMLPAVVSLATRNPLRAVGASALFAPWLAYAYYIDCIRPYAGGGASMVYVAVVLWGLPCAAFGAFVTDPLLRMLGLQVGGA